MRLTPEQIEIINSNENIKINAVAGSGKTTTVIEYARTRPANSKILYVVFNRSVKQEAIEKFSKNGLTNVTVETAHSLAYKHIVPKHGYKVRPYGYKTNEIAEMLNLVGNGEKHAEYIVANHINKLISFYCNSDKEKIEEANYLDSLSDSKSKSFVASFYKYMEKKAVLLLDKMNRGEIEVTHDFYLKKFQLLGPELKYDYILFDEGQDASAAMLSTFLKQRAVKVIVGDTNQQIYGWRQAVNSLEKVDFGSYGLSTSFRFGPDIARLATAVLGFKEYIGLQQNISISGQGDYRATRAKAVLARTNLGLLVKAIECVTEKVKHIYFEGNINSYTYAEEGASLYDVLNLSNGKHHLIKDKLLRAMKDLHELEDYVNKTEDMQLGMLVEIVKNYGDRIYTVLKTLKDKHVKNEERNKAELIFSTVHRSKGMEYDEVELVGDFITEKKLEDFKEKKNLKFSAGKLNEEINLLYVAVTRARVRLYIPETLLPKGFEITSENIQVLNEPVEELSTDQTKSYSVEEKRKTHKKAYAPWNAEADHELQVLAHEGFTVDQIAAHFGRTKGAIQSRLKKLGVEGFPEIYDGL
jgi:superfamily I DNA/RNA helicase